MEVQILSRKFIKSSTPTPNHLKTHKLSSFDQLAPPAHVPLLFFYPSDGISTTHGKLQKLQKSLSDTLTLFYPLSGRLIKEYLIVDCSDQGVAFFEAKVNVQLNEFLSLVPKKLELLNWFVPWDIGFALLPTTPMLGIQATFFECGGLVICVHASHVIADGFTGIAFINAWATATRLGIGEVVVRPSFDLSSVFPSRDVSGIVNLPPPNVGGGVKVVTRMFVFDAAKIEGLKDEIGGLVFGERKPSRVEVVMAAVWKALILAARARNEGKLRPSVMSSSVNLRGRTALTTPENPCGNFFMSTPTKFTPEQNTAEPNHNHLLGLIRESMRTSLSAFAKLSNSDEIFLAVANFHNQVTKSRLDENVDVHNFTSLCRFPLYETDFGWGKPCLVSNVCVPLEMVALMDTKCGTGIEAWVSLEEPGMLELEKDPDILGLITSSVRQLVVNGKQFDVKVVEQETFRFVDSIHDRFCTEANPLQEEEGEIDKSKDEVAFNIEKDQSKGDKKDGNVPEGNLELLTEGEASTCMEAGNKGGQKSFKDAVKEGLIHQVFKSPTQKDFLVIEEFASIHEGNSNASHGLDSYVEDSQGPIMEACQQYLSVQEDNIQSNKEILQMNNCVDPSKLCLNGPIVLDSNNSLRASQFPSLKIQVDLNPKVARKTLRKKIRESSMSRESSDCVENTINFITQGQKEIQVNNELQASAVAGRILGIDFNNEDLLVMEKMIELENNNRFAPLMRSTLKQ
ncbi:hypothetical protein Vadar_010491 [Vaccinium darrowii]|uniref:Uncharacterized protein n=1 Tax=Vaccinium darrowii TaxID=229202 RepID=A0ACB7ZAU9_9ERIC|nr:hypothetical protein Vadar_010491 [Vaccinium darrowii]